LTKELKSSSEKKTAFSTNGTGSTGSQHVEECKSIHSYLLVQSSKWIKEFHIKPDTLKLIEEKVGRLTGSQVQFIIIIKVGAGSI
jgi:hypothetical protein